MCFGSQKGSFLCFNQPNGKISVVLQPKGKVSIFLAPKKTLQGKFGTKEDTEALVIQQSNHKESSQNCPDEIIDDSSPFGF